MRDVLDFDGDGLTNLEEYYRDPSEDFDEKFIYYLLIV